jgi:chemotaxis protein CheD
MAEVVVRMGELAAARTPGDSLACIGLGSCIGLILVDVSMGAMAMAHVMLPEAPSGATPGFTPAKYANQALPALLDAICGVGGRPQRVEAIIAGGASMFALSPTSGPGQEIGERIAEAVRAELKAKHIRLLGDEVGGQRGRTVRAHVASAGVTPLVTVRDAGGEEAALLGDLVMVA